MEVDFSMVIVSDKCRITLNGPDIGLECLVLHEDSQPNITYKVTHRKVK